MAIQDQKQLLEDKIKKLQVLIETEADHAFKGILRQEKDVCFQKLLALTPTQNPQTPKKTKNKN
ncbi:hypothetical protein NHP21005_19070 (plasmid) [Helicobacter sp. NHP21005]|nr:hypothetical protein NHP21005_19070 [Helicobacter sp. NHP21005]